MGPEDIVVEEVVDYFSTPRFKRFSLQKEYAIQIGSYRGRADVALIDTDETLAAIVECKRSGYEGSGPDQLKSYLAASGAPLGVFANETNPAAWQFYENLRWNQFKTIDRSRFEARLLKRGVIRTLRNFVRSLFQQPPDEPPDVSSPPTSPPTEPFDPPIVRPDYPRISHIGGDQPLQDNNNVDFDPSLNGNPYYSEASGFYWAANHHGIPECVPQHVKRIISNEELQIHSHREQLQAEIDELVGEKNGLEAQQREYEREIGQRSQDFARKREELAGLEVQLGAPTETELNPSPVEALDPDDTKQQLDAEISQLGEGKDKVQREIEEKSQMLSRKREELAGLEVQLGAPTETELTPAPESVPQVHAKKWYSWMSGIPTGIVASVATVVLIALAAYLFIFYASAVDKAFFLNEDKIQQQVEEGTYAGVQDIVNPNALSKVFQAKNYFVLFFPCLFLGFALALDHFWEFGKIKWVVGLVAITFIFDVLLAIHISLKIHQAEVYIAQRLGQLEPQWTLYDNFLNILTVIFCGFVASLLVSVLYSVTRDRWEQVKQFQPQSKEQEIREVQIRDEKVQRDAQIAVLRTEMENVEGEIGPLQGEIGRLNEKVRTTQQKIEEWSREQLDARIRAERSPIEARIAVLKMEMETLQGGIDQLNDKVKTVQQRIDQCQAKIEELSDLRNKRIINGHQMELRVNRFLNGWCRFVANSEDGAPNVSAQINKIKQVAYETLNQYYEDLEGYSSQSRVNSTVEI